MVSRRGFVAGLSSVSLAGCLDLLPRSAPKNLPESKDPVRGESDVNLEFRERGDGENVELVVDGETRPIPDQTELSSEPVLAGGHGAFRYVADELDVDLSNGPLRFEERSVSRQQDSVPLVYLMTWIDRDGELVRGGTEIEFERLVAVTPRSISVRYGPDDSDSSSLLPVFAAREVGRYY